MNQSVAEPDHNPWVESIIRPLVIGVMAGCVAWSLAQLMLVFSPDWNPVYLTAGCVLAALEAFYSYRFVQTPRVYGINVLRFRAGELSLVFLLLRMGRFIDMSWTKIAAELQAWPHNLALVFDLQTLAAFIPALACWWAATNTARDLDGIGQPPRSRQDHGSPVESLTGRFFAGGAVLLVAAGLSRIEDASELLDLHRPPARGLVLNVLIYFLLGLVLLAQARLIELRKRWQGQEAQVADRLPGRWLRYSLSFIGLAVLLAFVLPTGFAQSPLTWIAAILSLFVAASLFIASWLLFLLLLPFGLFFVLLSTLSGKPDSSAVPRPPSFEPPQQALEGRDGTSWSLILFVIALVVIIYLVRSYLRHRPKLRVTISALSSLQLLRQGWSAFWRWLRRRSAHLRGAVKNSFPHLLRRRLVENGSLELPFRLLRLRTLSPRERVLYYYLSTLRRASRQGYPRHPHQTPGEYQATLEPNLPQAQDEMRELTQAFVEARYSRHEVAPDQDRRVRASWERVKAALRALKRLRDSDT